MKRRTLLGALLVGTAGCIDRRRLTEQTEPNETDSSNTTTPETVTPAQNASFTTDVSEPPPPQSPPTITVDGATVTVVATVTVPNSCYELRHASTEYESASERLVVTIDAEDTSDPDVNCPSELSYESYRYETTLSETPVSEIELDHPIDGDDGTYPVSDEK